MAVFRQKVRIRFAKRGDLRFISHHDLMRLFERAVRRAGLPIRMSEGFNPRPRISFPLSLSTGTEGRDEVAEIQLDDWVPPAEVGRRLQAAFDTHLPAAQVLAAGSLGSVPRPDLPGRVFATGPISTAGQGLHRPYRPGDTVSLEPGLAITNLKTVDARRNAEVVEVTYTIEHEAIGRLSAGDLEALMARPEAVVGRVRKGRPAAVDIRPYVRGLALMSGRDRPTLRVDLGVTPRGTARPDEVLEVLGIRPGPDEPAPRIVRERVRLADEPRVAGPGA